MAEVSAGLRTSLARTQSGAVWAWGANTNGEFGDDSRTTRSVPVRIPIIDVTQISLGRSLALFRKGNGEVWFSGYVGELPWVTVPTRKTGLPPVSAVAAGGATAYAIDNDGALWAWGDNARGQIGNGTTALTSTPVKITAVTGRVLQVVSDAYHAAALTEDGSVWTWGDNSAGQLGDGTTASRLVPKRISGLANVVEIATSARHMLARLRNGTLMSWGSLDTRPLGREGDFRIPGLVQGIDRVARIAAGFEVSAAIRDDGTVWAWGANCESRCATLGDGTYIARSRPVVVVAERGAGSIDGGDWYLDLRPGTPKAIPPDRIPKLVPVVQSLSDGSILNVDATVGVQRKDVGKKLGLYVVGLVLPAFLDQVTTAPGALAKRARMKADQPVLVNLTPSGWTVAAGQLEALRTGTGNASLGASNLLVNVDPAAIPGARFCIGYGESSSDMLTTGMISDFLSLPGASSSATDVPCILSGVYVDGPPTSPVGMAVPVRAVVVGQGPTGAVRFRERFRDISPDVALAVVNTAVADASFSYTPPGVGEYAFGASYPGDARNAAAASEVPLRHLVNEVLAQTSTKLAAALTSELGGDVELVAHVSGNRPGGTVQLKRGGVNEGTPVPVVDDQAVFSVAGLRGGDHSFTASYSGDTANPASDAGVFVHKVLDVATSEVILASSTNPSPMGSSVTLAATVAGSNPSGVVTLREGPVVIASAGLANGMASFGLNGLGAGVRTFHVDYGGDGSNPAATSNAVFQQVTLAGTPATLTVSRSGTGSGTVTSAPSGIHCGTTCAAEFLAGSSATLAATAASGSIFAGWSGGGCSGTGTCTVAIDSAKSVTATFSASTPGASNYTALWWNAAESGWGINLNHQGNIVFGTLFTYDAIGAPLWLVMSDGRPAVRTARPSPASSTGPRGRPSTPTRSRRSRRAT